MIIILVLSDYFLFKEQRTPSGIYELPTCCFVAQLRLWHLIASIWEDQVHFIGRELLNCYVTFSSYMCQKLRPKSYKLGTTKPGLTWKPYQ